MPEPFNASTWLVDRHVEAGSGNRVAFLCADRELSYAQLRERIEAVSAGLRALGVRPEERVALVLRDSLELAVGFLAALRMGAIALPLNPLLPAADLAGVVHDARARIAVVHADAAALAALLQEIPEITDVISVGGTAPPGATAAWDDLASAGLNAAPATTLDESPAFWLCTSGTTGKPKLAMHRHADIRTVSEGYAAEVLTITASDRALSLAPLFHAYGLGNSLIFPLGAGASAVLEPTRPPTAALVAALIRRHAPTLFFAVPTFYGALLSSDLPRDAFTGVRQGVSAGEALPGELFARFRDRFGVEVLDGIGSTEMTHIFVSNRRGQVVPGASGRAVTGHRLRIQDDQGREVADGEPGQLYVSGEAAAVGYWCRAPETRSTFVGDWVRTGDVYRRDAGGIYYHLGRQDDMFKVSGEWVSPGEVEDVLLAHAGVVEAAVVGGRDADGLTRVVAFVVQQPGSQLEAGELIEHCRGRLAGYKRPRQAVLVDTLPKTATGKIRRNELRQRAATLLETPVA